MSREGSDLLEMAAMIARDYLPGPWRHASQSNIVVKKVTGGLSNWLYQMSLPQTVHIRDQSVPRTVLLRFHGQVNGESTFEHIVTESVVFTLLSERKLGPKLYGIFPGGRVEEYINARPLKVQEMSDPEIAVVVAEKMASIHRLVVPTCKRPTWMFDLCTKYINTIQMNQDQFKGTDSRTQGVIDSLSSYDFFDELDWLRDYLESVDSKVVFCHNDLNEGNILLPLDECKGPKDIVIIDFEYCAYNYRAFDMANHFLEHTLEYTSEPPYFHFDPTIYPSREHQKMFARTYLKNYLRGSSEPGQSAESEENVNSFEDEVNKLVGEVESLRIACHFFWALWSAANAVNKIPFGYWEFFEERFETYLKLKSEVVSFDVPGPKRRR